LEEKQMSVSTLAFSATLPPFNYTNGFNNNFSNTNLTATGNLSVATGVNSALPNSATVGGSVTANGINFLEKNATINGNSLTVSYQANEINHGVTTPSLVNINTSGVQFSPNSATTNGANVTTTYHTSPNGNFNVPINGAAYSTSNSTDHDNITLKSLSLVGNTLTATYQFNTSLPDNTVLAPHVQVSTPDTTTVSVGTPSAVNGGGATFDSRGVSSIGDVLAASSGITFNGTLTGALQQPPTNSQTTGIPTTNAALAAVLNPSLNLSPSTSLQVTDFIDTSLNAFPTSAPSDTFSNPNNNNNNNDNSNSSSNSNSSFDNTGNASSTYGSQSTRSSSSSNNFTSSNSSSTNSAGASSIYSAISNSNASTIRGTGVNTVA
jgi:hypothetical protein